MLRLDSAREIRYQFSGAKNVATPEPAVARDNGVTTYTWIGKDIPAYQP